MNTRGDVRARVVAGVLVVGALGTAAGCASLLGDFELQGSSDAGTNILTADAASADAGISSDGATPEGSPSGPADAGSPLSCTTWRYAQPVVLETLSAGNRRVSGTLTVASGPGTQARVIAGKSTTGVAFSAYTIDTSDAGAASPGVTQLDAPVIAGSEYAGWARGGGSVAPATTVLAYAPAAEGGVLGEFSAYILPDALDASGPLPAPHVVFTETPQIPEVDAIRVLPLDPASVDAGAVASFFVAVAYPSTIATDANAAEYTLGVGLATGGTSGAPAALSPLATSADVSDLNDPRLFRAGGEVYVFGSTSASSASLPLGVAGEDGAAPTAAAPNAVWAGVPGHIDAIGPSSSSGAADLAVEQQLSVGGYVTTIDYLAGAVPYADLTTWTVPGQHAADAASPSLASVDDFTNVFTAPDGIPCGSVWSNDSIMLLGPGLAPAGDGGSSVSGMNMLWFDSQGVVHGSQAGSQALLLGREGFATVAASPSAIATASARWDVAWVETHTDDAGAYDVVFYNELDCQ